MAEKKKILVLDDDSKWLSTINFILGETYNLTMTANPDEALSLLRVEKYSLIILDKKLQGIDGLHILIKIQEIIPGQAVIMLTGYPDTASAVESLKLGALYYISKGDTNLTSVLEVSVEAIIPPAPIQVFLCYARIDGRRVRKLYSKLEAAGFQPWLDTYHLLPGDDWDYKISKAIEASQAFIACLSQKSVDEMGFFRMEIKQALHRQAKMPDGKIYFIPARLDECRIIEEFKKHHCVNLFEKNGFSKLAKVLNTLK